MRDFVSYYRRRIRRRGGSQGSERRLGDKRTYQKSSQYAALKNVFISVFSCYSGQLQLLGLTGVIGWTACRSKRSTST